MIGQHFIPQRILSLAKYSRRAKKKQHHIGIFVIDIDNFKQINDTYGHNRGDEVLQFISSILRSFTENEGIVIRWGGDEFVVIIPKFSQEIEQSLLHVIELETKQYRLTEEFPLMISCGKAYNYFLYYSTK